MKTSRKRYEEYAAGIDKALRRAAKQAALTAAITGTRLIIFENDRIKRLRPRIKPNTIKMVRDIYAKPTGGYHSYPHFEIGGLGKVQENLRTRRAGRKRLAVAEGRTKYRSR